MKHRLTKYRAGMYGYRGYVIISEKCVTGNKSSAARCWGIDVPGREIKGYARSRAGAINLINGILEKPKPEKPKLNAHEKHLIVRNGSLLAAIKAFRARTGAELKTSVDLVCSYHARI